MVQTTDACVPNDEKHQKHLRMFKLYQGLYAASERFFDELASIDR
jgi:hypothetical protein